MLQFVFNDSQVTARAPHGLPALDYLRREAGLTGVKYACREGDCGSCSVLLGRPLGDRVRYKVVTSCLLPLGAVDRRHVVTVEGLNAPALGPVQSAFVRHGASQCGFCTPGFIVSLTGHLLEAGSWRERDMVEAVAGNICRCTGYTSILRAIRDLVQRLESSVDPTEARLPALVREGFVPPYFPRVGALLADLGPPLVPEAPPRGSTLVAGGTDLYVQRPLEVEDGPVFVLREPDSEPIRREGGYVYLAAGATAEDMKRSSVLAETVGGVDRAMALMGSWPIRARATVAGNLVNASPIGDMTAVLLALEAELGLVRSGERRTLPLDAFYLGYKRLDLRAGELVEWVRFATPGAGARFNFEKVSKRTHLDIASVNSAISVVMDGNRMVSACLSAGGVAPVPTRLPRTEAVLAGREADAGAALAAAAAARSEVAPISDVRGSAEYKRLLLGQLVLAHFNVLFGIEDGLLAGVSA